MFTVLKEMIYRWKLRSYNKSIIKLTLSREKLKAKQKAKTLKSEAYVKKLTDIQKL